MELQTLSHGLLALLHRTLMLGEGDGYVQVSALHKALPITLSEAYVRRALDELIKAEYVIYDSDDDTITISNRGIKYYDNQAKKDDSNISIIRKTGNDYFYENSDSTTIGEKDAWKKSDYQGELNQETTEKIRVLLKQAISELPQAGLSNQEQSQATARLEAADKLANAPTPPWGKVKELLSPLSDLVRIGAFIVDILRLIVGF